MALISLLVSALQVASPVGDYPQASDRLKQAAPSLSQRPNLDLRGYEISGRTWNQLRAQMEAMGPVVEGRRFAGYTVGSVDYSFSQNPCRPEETEVTVWTAVVVPDLVDAESLSRSERERWDRYFEGLVDHELNHVVITENGRDQIAQAMHSATDCDASLYAGAAAAAASAEAQVEFDRRTNHGVPEPAR